jgi:hypothetical protein
MSIEAMKQALQTLEGWANVDGWVWPETAKEQALRNTVEAITALRQAIAQAEQKPCLKGGQCKHGSWCSEVYCQEHCEFVEQAEQAQPVAWMWEVVINDVESCHVTQCDPPEYATKRTPLYTAPPQSKQYVATIDTSSERVDKTQNHRQDVSQH